MGIIAATSTEVISKYLDKLKSQPYTHQIEAEQIMLGEDGFGLLMEMGTGKSKTLIDVAAIEHMRNDINGLIIVAPKSIMRMWRDEQIPQHMPDCCRPSVVVWGSNTKTLQKNLDKLLVHDGLAVFIINPEAAITERGAEYVWKFLKKRKVLIAVDESTMIKNPDANRTKLIIRFGREAKKRAIMTGSPLDKPMDVWSQFEFLGPAKLGFSSFVAFRNRFAIMRKRYINGREFNSIEGYQRLDELRDRIARVSYRKLKVECLDLPNKIYQRRDFELTTTQKQYYEQLKHESVAELSNGDFVAVPLILTKYLRLRQALCNIAPSADGETVVSIDDKNPRLDLLMETLEEAGNQVVIWSYFIPAIMEIEQRIKDEHGKDSCSKFIGEMSGDERNEAAQAFVRGDLKYLIVNPRVGARGLTLVNCHTAVYYDNDWALEPRIQSEDRLHRIGQHNPVTYVDLVAPNTMDERIRNCLVNKQDLADQVTGDDLRRNLLKLLG